MSTAFVLPSTLDGHQMNAGRTGPEPWIPMIPEHRVLRRIGHGAYGEVWLAFNALGTARAVKVVRLERFEGRNDFEREYRGLQRFEPISRFHDALVQVLQIGIQEDWFYYVMELADDARVQNDQQIGLESWKVPQPGFN